MVDRKLATWEWCHPEIPGVTGVLEFEVRIAWGKGSTQSFKYHRINEGPAPKFYIHAKNQGHKSKGPLRPEFRIESGDIAVLAQKLNDHLLAYYAVEWEDMLAVWWERTYHGRLDASLSMTVTPWKRGRTPTADITYWKNMGHTSSRVLDHPPRTHVYGKGDEEDRKVDIPIIPDTPENRKILADLALRLGTLGDRLADLLHGDDIVANLQQLSGLALPEGTTPDA